jgi:D-alanyl-D-alanine carboxypeptidase
VKLLTIFIVLIGLAGAGYLLFSDELEGSVSRTETTTSSLDTTQESTANAQLDIEPESDYDIDTQDSLYFVVNKNRPVSVDYEPEGMAVPNVPLRIENMLLRPEAASALEALFAAALEDGYELQLGSAYRSSATQESLYNNYVATFGQAEADRFSARPGTSEHQLGLAADVSGIDGACYLEACFGDTPEGIWVAENAGEFGFIIRYTEGSEAITGYTYEPWHLRYLGEELAKEITDANLTLEEFFEL